MTLETQNIEYKDFSKSVDLNKKSVLSNLFKEISAFANSGGGKLIIGKDDKNGDLNAQPEELLNWLKNDSLTTQINQISNNLITFQSNEENGIVTIVVKNSEEVISVNSDYIQ